MKTPKRIEPLIEDGLVDEVLRPLMSGKEAAVYVVRCGNELRCAKVYKEANKRSFRQAAEYQEGRKVRNSRQARAMAKGSKFGRKETEDAWQNAEVAALFRLASAGVRVPKPYDFLEGVLLMELVADSAGVRVPKPYDFLEGVLLMELVADEYGDAAPRLNDVVLEPDQAREYHAFLIEQIVLMLCAGLVHGDLSEFNVLLAPSGPVIIDLPQAVDAAGNNHAFSMLERDVGNMALYFGRFAPELRSTKYAKEMWSYYEAGTLSPTTVLTGEFDEPEDEADVGGVLREIEAARLDEARRQAARAADDAPPSKSTEEPPPPWMQ
ncbi:kinase [Pseudomonas viridiflava ICMP 13104]|uniref:non-specific serine/threonine protein kinase n=1 Tax=Pseudomonas viridiflava ICMP 13104 TaxID=1198305 RepID=A0A0W0HLF7_PSEVI|nr:kinase [Pseudomonas viridiflava ICMP 13104]